MDIVVAAFLGLVIGSFLNVFIYRWPQIDEDLSDSADRTLGFLALPLSFCPQCRAPIKPWHNIPVVSYFVLRGRCGDCSARIPLQYPLVEALGGILLVWAVHVHGWGITAAAAVIFGATLLAISAIDIRSFLIADRLVIPLLWLGLLANIDAQFATLREAVAGAMAGYALIFLLRQGGFLLARKEVIGMGDAKLMAAVGAWLGYPAVPFVLFLGAVLGLLFALPRLALKGNRKRYRFISFGPFLSAAAAIMLFWGDDIRYGYLTMMGMA